MAHSQRPEPRYYANVQMMMYYTIQDFARAASGRTPQAIQDVTDKEDGL
ncbi:MAG: hypothetical protein OXH09_19305 [Gammaproteobacteria bacterium]|nr:hypothetical protein [Gammaproteobacteria bacterium]